MEGPDACGLVRMELLAEAAEARGNDEAAAAVDARHVLSIFD